MLKILRKLLPETGFIRLAYHKFKAILAWIFYLNPSSKMLVIGVTGTDGKTTTSNLIAQMLSHLGYKVGMASTVNFRIGDQVITNTAKMTTSSPFALQKLLRKMRKAKVEVVVLEVSSHAVLQNRIWGINFDVGVLTNISEDHIEYHGSKEAYYMTKASFLASLHSMRRRFNVQKTLVLNADDDLFGVFDKLPCDVKYTYGLNSKKAIVRAVDNFVDSKKVAFNLKAPNIDLQISAGLIGEFNVYNILAAASVGLALGAKPAELEGALCKLKAVSGRMQLIDCGQKYTVVSDYAHATSALENLCQVFEPLTNGRIILVFGCVGGGRDKRKRPMMGEVAAKYADVVVLTNDDPYEEDSWEIISQIEKGMTDFPVEHLHKIVDRRQALKFAIEMAQDDDTILVAGKGGEKVTIVNGEKLPFDEENILEELISKREFQDIQA